MKILLSNSVLLSGSCHFLTLSVSLTTSLPRVYLYAFFAFLFFFFSSLSSLLRPEQQAPLIPTVGTNSPQITKIVLQFHCFLGQFGIFLVLTNKLTPSPFSLFFFQLSRVKIAFPLINCFFFSRVTTYNCVEGVIRQNHQIWEMENFMCENTNLSLLIKLKR